MVEGSLRQQLGTVIVEALTTVDLPDCFCNDPDCGTCRGEGSEDLRAAAEVISEAVWPLVAAVRQETAIDLEAIADDVRSQASISSRPGQFAKLSSLAAELDRLGAALARETAPQDQSEPGNSRR